MNLVRPFLLSILNRFRFQLWAQFYDLSILMGNFIVSKANCKTDKIRHDHLLTIT